MKNNQGGPGLAALTFISLARILLLCLIPMGFWKFCGPQLVESKNLLSAQGITFIICAIVWCIIFASKDYIVKQERKTRAEQEFNEDGLSMNYDELQALSKAERAEVAKQRLADMERILSTGTIRKMTKEGSKDPDADLEKLLGLPDIKKQIREMNARMEFDRQKMQDDIKANKRKKNDHNKEMISSMHMCFFGPPGTGKTTSCKIITGYLFRNGYIKYNQYLEADGNTLRGETPAETTEKTRLILKAAKGKVLFIDEAYALLSSADAQEAMGTLIKAMEDDRNDFIIILAGYEKEMKTLIEANPGFYSRITQYLYFGNYSIEELCDIFSAMANEHNFYVCYEARERFAKRIAYEQKRKYFGNARTCRNVLDESVSKHALNLKQGLIPENMRYTSCPEDIAVTPPREL